MVTVSFTPNLQRHVSAPPSEVEGSSVAEVLAAVFAHNEQARGYVLDDQGGLRQHMRIFVDGAPLLDRVGLSDTLKPESDVHVMQALSGG
ncbi:MAG: molybdopterin synthase sulfur carrier subunit [Pseudohongiellaceae bacterium]|jgi:molybdopterin synthase sulfur carrier subunit